MRRPVVLAVASLLAVGAAVVCWLASRAPTDPKPSDASPAAIQDPDSSPPSLAAPPPRARAVHPPEEPGAREAPEPPTGPRRMVRARLVAVDAATNAPIDPQAPFHWRFGTGADEQYQSFAPRVGEGVREISAMLPLGADATEVTVTIYGWGFRPFRRKFPLRVREGVDFEEIRIPLESVAASAWSPVRLELVGEGALVTDAEAIRLSVSRSGNWDIGPRLLVDFESGAPRVRDVRVPFAPGDLEVLGGGRMRDEDGRRVWVGPPRVRVDPPSAEAAAPVTFRIVRLPAAVLEFEMRYPRGDRPAFFYLWGGWSSTSDGPRQRSSLATTFSVAVEGGADLVRVERSMGSLSGVSGTAAGFDFIADPTGPIDVRPPETRRVVVELRRRADSPPK